MHPIGALVEQVAQIGCRRLGQCDGEEHAQDCDRELGLGEPTGATLSAKGVAPWSVAVRNWQKLVWFAASARSMAGRRVSAVDRTIDL